MVDLFGFRFKRFKGSLECRGLFELKITSFSFVTVFVVVVAVVIVVVVVFVLLSSVLNSHSNSHPHSYPHCHFVFISNTFFGSV